MGFASEVRLLTPLENAHGDALQRSRNFSEKMQNRVGAAEGCDLLILLEKAMAKDRSLRQLLQGDV
ncbi:hypothetical protein [Pseudomonas koreensis]|uniref:hypothetical protein n=1 Tax=Pseudomonas koreensis TaxID=198620 RepID=UPI003F859BF0